MPDYFTQFSCVLDVGTPDNATRALGLYKAFAAELERDNGECPGFEVSVETDSPDALWIRSEDHGDPDHVILFVLRCGKAFKLKGPWGFAWAHTCSKPQLDAFTGGACHLDLGARKTVARINCDHWLEVQLNKRAAAARAKTRRTKKRPR